MNVFGIETSCDETAASVVVDGHFVRSNVISSQIAIHQAYGGIVPELAARGQIQAIVPVVRAALEESGLTWEDIDAIAFTQGPGLAGSLIAGANAAKGIAIATGHPLIGVNHLAAHVYANWLQIDGHPVDAFELPAICLLVSGGHTELLLVQSATEITVLGRTLDDAAGEAFDKGARLLGLGYPGGPAIQQAGSKGNRESFSFPRAEMPGPYDFSFSGLKTSLLRAVQPHRIEQDVPRRDPSALFPEHRPPAFREDLPLADLAAAFEEAIVDALVSKTLRAATDYAARTVMLAGGVAANARLRERLRELAPSEVSVQWPPMSLCTDNAAMIAGLGYHLLQAGLRTGLNADVFPRSPIESVAPMQKDSQ